MKVRKPDYILRRHDIDDMVTYCDYCHKKIKGEAIVASSHTEMHRYYYYHPRCARKAKVPKKLIKRYDEWQAMSVEERKKIIKKGIKGK